MTSPVRGALSTARDAFRSQLWPIPVIGVAVALAVGLALPYLDRSVDQHLPGWLDVFVFGGDPDASRTVLDAVASSLITVTSLTFSLTVVTLQLASSQFSPRLLRTFTQDVFVQATLALFLATFTYALTVLRVVRSSADGSGAFVPRLSVTLSFLLAIASVIGLVLFLAHLTRQIRVETMLHNVQEDAIGTIAVAVDERGGERSPAPGRPIMAQRIDAADSGFLLTVNRVDLVKVAEDLDAVISIDREPGDFIVSGTLLATIWRRDGSRITDGDDVARLEKKIRRAVHLGPERTAAQDIGHGLRQLTDVVAKALSPGINDPTTAAHALGHTSAVLVDLMRHELGPATVCDDDDVPRLILNQPTFARSLEVALAQPRRYGASDPMVDAALFRLLEDLAWNAPAEYRDEIASQLERLAASIADEDFDAFERARFATLDRQVTEVLRGPPTPRV